MLMVEMLARMPDLRRRIQAEHIADARGRCRDCHGAQWPCELYRLAIEVDRRYGPCPASANWPGPPRQTQPGAVPRQSLMNRPGPPVGRGAPPTPPGGARRPGAPVAPLPTGVTPLPPSRTRTPGRPAGRPTEAGVALPVPRTNRHRQLRLGTGRAAHPDRAERPARRAARPPRTAPGPAGRAARSARRGGAVAGRRPARPGPTGRGSPAGQPPTRRAAAAEERADRRAGGRAALVAVTHRAEPVARRATAAATRASRVATRAGRVARPRAAAGPPCRGGRAARPGRPPG